MSDPLTDPRRLAALARSGLLDTAPEEVFDRLTRLAARLLGTPVAAISLVDADRQFVKSVVGSDLTETPLSHSFCRYVVADGAPLTVDDAREHARLHNHPATRELGVVSYCGVPLTDADGHTLGSFCVVSPEPREWGDDDVSVLSDLASAVMTELELRAANRALSAEDRRQARLAQAVESTLDAVITVDAAGRVTSWNESAERLYGYAAHEVLGLPLSEVSAPSPAVATAQDEALMPRVLAGDRIVARAVRRRHRCGHTLYVDLSAAPLRGPGGELIGATAIARDVTEQHQLELELAQSEEQFRRTFDDGPNGMALVAPDGRFLQVNRALCEVLGYSEAELLERAFQELTHPDDLGGDLEALAQVLGGDVPTYRMEKRYLHKAGHTIWSRLSVALVRDETGAPMHFVSHVEDITGAKESELALREGRRLLDESQAVAGLGSWSWNLETGERAWSRQQFVLHGLEPAGEAPSLEAFLELVHPEDREQVAGGFAAEAEHRADVSGEYRVVLPDGGVRTLLTRGDFLPADPAAGLPPRLAGTTRDVTAERAAEAAQRDVESRHRVLLSSLPDTMIVLYDRDLRCVLLQGGHPHTAPERYEGRALREVIPPEQFRTLEPHVTRALAGEPGSLEYVAASGLTYHVDVVPYRPDGGEVTGIFTVWRDMTEARERDRHTRKLATIVRQSGDAIIAASPDGVITEWNQGAERQYGYSTQEAVGRPLSMLTAPQRRDDERRLLERALLGRPVGRTETSRVRRDGSTLEVSISVSPLYDADGSIAGVSVIERDVTERRRMEDELRASREQALEASRLKSEFVANMSHEIRTPLNGVVSMAELLLGTELTGEQADYAKVALTSAEALMRVIDDILDFSKIEAGKLEIVNEDFSVRTAIREVCEIVRAKATERGLDLTASVDPAVAPVLRGDASRVRQVLLNLLSNAVKFTSQGEVRVTVDVLGDGGGQRLRVQVADTGIGIAADRLPGLFQPFSQADATTTRRYGGTGLGLCICKQLVELMGGGIDCDSTPGAGSTFSFTIPYAPGADDRSPSPHSDLTGTRILIVDGNATQRRWLEDRLAGWGISPDSTGDGFDALRLLRRAADAGRPYEAALIEHALAEMDGLELARAIKAVPALRATRLVLLSGSEVATARADEAGVDDHIVKPIRQSRLYNGLLGAIHRQTLGLAAAGVPHEPAPDDAADSGARVLVAEDNDVNQFAAIRLLQTFGLTVDIARNGREAINMTARRNYAAVFMDCQMPEVDGYTATREIRRRERGGARTPIVALTAHALEGDREKCLAAGMDDYLTKPLRLQMIESLMQRLPALRPADPEAAAAGDGEPVFDPEPLREIGDADTEAALAMMFLDQASERLPALLAAIEGGDFQQVHALAHGLKGTAATVGARRISELSRSLCHTAGETLTPEEATAIHARLTEALAQTRAAVDGYLAL